MISVAELADVMVNWAELQYWMVIYIPTVKVQICFGSTYK